MSAHDAAHQPGGADAGRIIEGDANIAAPLDLAAQINHEHDLAVQCAENALEYAYRKTFVQAIRKEDEHNRLATLFYVLDLFGVEDEFAQWCENTRCMREARQ